MTKQLMHRSTSSATQYLRPLQCKHCPSNFGHKMHRSPALVAKSSRRACRRITGRQLLQLRPYADLKSPDHDGPAENAASQETSHHGVHAAPANESLGRGFYITIAAVISSLALYKFSRSSADGEEPLLTRFIHKYDSIQDEFRRRGNLQVQYLDAAARDRALWQHTEKNQHVNLRFPEIFDTGCPTNVPAGSQANLDKLYEHFDREREEAEKIRLERGQRREENERRWQEIREREGRSTLLGSIAGMFGSQDGEDSGK